MSKAEAARHMVKANLALISAAPLSYLSHVVGAMSHYWSPSASPLANMNSKAL